ncbi:NAD(P)-binding protein [Ideonella azotifigens]|uniref:NAD(P)/FAD-dependent oxidoreductase n=1 Tax=Ideonella azotifigens TaxID=513160 RepID=A0ABP3UWL5_9BURK|nr:NAD(P)-binding protein [Ideonella azotifigens]
MAELPRPARPWSELLPQVSRRDLLHGAGALALSSAAIQAKAADTPPAGPPPDHPSRRTGLQGQTDSVNHAAHAWRDHPEDAREAVAERDPEIEDLVVVGAGISGLAGAHLFRQHAGRPVRVLLLDALDDLGGHARRNEFVSRSGRRLVGYGGSQSLDSPGLFSPAMHTLLQDLGIELKRFETEFYDSGWAERHGLRSHGLYFGEEAWPDAAPGASRLVLPGPDEAAGAWLARTPLPPRAQADLQALLATEPPAPLRRPLPGSRAARRRALAALRYDDFLRRHWQVHPAVLRYLQANTQGYFGVGTDATSALDAWAGGLPGFASLDLGSAPDRLQSPSGRHLMAGTDRYIYHFPDGNAGLARALLRRLIPAALPGSGMAGLADGVLQHAELDRPDSPVRLRLQSTVLGLRHLGPPAQAELVELRYVDAGGRLRTVRARQVLLACWHRVIARLTDELPAAQTAALNDQVKVPLLYANVLLSNWQAFARGGLDAFSVAAGFWAEAGLDFPVRMGTLGPPDDPSQPILLHLAKVVVPGDGQPARAQAAQGRSQLLGWDFDFLEQQSRALLQGALGGFGFDHTRDIEALTVNRWAHGYAYEYMRPWDAWWPTGPLPCETARRGWGRVQIANSDAGAYAYAHSAVDQATRAVQALLPHASLPRWHAGPGPEMPLLTRR